MKEMNSNFGIDPKQFRSSIFCRLIFKILKVGPILSKACDGMQTSEASNKSRISKVAGSALNCSNVSIRATNSVKVDGRCSKGMKFELDEMKVRETRGGNFAIGLQSTEEEWRAFKFGKSDKCDVFSFHMLERSLI
jgi:hypothetical protein